MNYTPPIDPVLLTADLVRCRSVTPAEGGALVLLENLLTLAGFQCLRIDRNGIPNLFAKFQGPENCSIFGFNGHTDVVPTGNVADWSRDPFSGDIADGYVWGRGATDMKSGVASFVAASIDFVSNNPAKGTVIITVTGDEEGIATDGTRAILDWMNGTGETMDACLVGEPTCPLKIGQMVKIGRRGSMTAKFNIHGQQGHSAYPERARNPVQAIAYFAHMLDEQILDEGSTNFAPSTLVITNIDTGNTASNVIPASCQATVNIRFNDHHTSTSLFKWLRRQANQVEKRFGVTIEMEKQSMGECFLTPPGPLSNLVSRSVKAELGHQPELSTSGGTSDARFIKNICPVVEFGLTGQNMHQTDERASIEEIKQLKSIYLRILNGFFA